jgi:hypothetical protein
MITNGDDDDRITTEPQTAVAEARARPDARAVTFVTAEHFMRESAPDRSPSSGDTRSGTLSIASPRSVLSVARSAKRVSWP